MMANDDKLIGLKFMRLGMLALAVGMFLGVIGGFQFVFPEFLRELLFTKTRPLHVSLVVSWIFLIAIGGIYFYLPRQQNLKLWSPRAANVHFWVFVITGIAILSHRHSVELPCRQIWRQGVFRVSGRIEHPDFHHLDPVWRQLLQDNYQEQGTVARVLLDVGYRHHLFLHHVL
jgi:nitric oxide reductase large subunit